MSVLNCLHEEYMAYIYELSSLIESTLEHDDEALSAGKILVNLSKNPANLENLLKLTVRQWRFATERKCCILFQGVELRTIVNFFTSKKDLTSKSDDALLRYLNFYGNLAEAILAELQRDGDTNNNTTWFNDPTPQRQGALYFEFFNHVGLSSEHISYRIGNSLFRKNKSSRELCFIRIIHRRQLICKWNEFPKRWMRSVIVEFKVLFMCLTMNSNRVNCECRELVSSWILIIKIFSSAIGRIILANLHIQINH